MAAEIEDVMNELHPLKKRKTEIQHSIAYAEEKIRDNHRTLDQFRKRNKELVDQSVNEDLQEDILEEKKGHLLAAWNKLRAFSQQF